MESTRVKGSKQTASDSSVFYEYLEKSIILSKKLILNSQDPLFIEINKLVITTQLRQIQLSQAILNEST